LVFIAGAGHRGFGFVQFQNADDAAAAIDNMNNAELNGRVIRVHLANQFRKPPPSNRASTDQRAATMTWSQNGRLTSFFRPYSLPYARLPVWTEDWWLREHALKAVESDMPQPPPATGADGAALSSEEGQAAKKPKIEIKPNPRVYFDIAIDGTESGRIEMQVRRWFASYCGGLAAGLTIILPRLPWGTVTSRSAARRLSAQDGWCVCWRLV